MKLTEDALREDFNNFIGDLVPEFFRQKQLNSLLMAGHVVLQIKATEEVSITELWEVLDPKSTKRTEYINLIQDQHILVDLQDYNTEIEDNPGHAERTYAGLYDYLKRKMTAA